MANDSVQVPFNLTWAGDPRNVPSPVTSILLRAGNNHDATHRPSEFYLTFGHVNPPMLSVEEAMNLNDTVQVPVSPVGEFVMSLERLVELRDVLSDFISDINRDAEDLGK